MNRVLVVDDDLQLLIILQEGLRKYKTKFQIVTAKDGLEAIKALREGFFNLVVTDLHMPTVNGLVLLAYMGKNYPKTPCIVMTGYGTPFLKKRLQQEAAHYLEKPFNIEELAKAIIQVLNQEVLKGTLNGISVVGFLKLIEMEYITCLCEITTPKGIKGYMYFERGMLYNAYIDKIQAERAAMKLIQLDDVTIKFRKPPKKKIPKKIKKSLNELIMEAMRVKDEIESPMGKQLMKKLEENKKKKMEEKELGKTDELLRKAKKQAGTIEKEIFG